MNPKIHLYGLKTSQIKKPLSSIFNTEEKEIQKPVITEVIKVNENNCHSLPFNEDLNINEDDSNSFQYSLPFEMDKSSDNFYFCFPSQKTNFFMPKVTLNKKISFHKKNNICKKYSKKRIKRIQTNDSKSPINNREQNHSKENNANFLMRFYTKRDNNNSIYSNRNKKIKLSFNKDNKCMSTSRKKVISKRKNTDDKDDKNYVKKTNKNLYNFNKSNIDTNYSTKIENENTKEHFSNFLDSPINVGTSSQYYFTHTQSKFNYKKSINTPMNKNKDMKILIINGNVNKNEYNSQKKLKSLENIKKNNSQKKNGFLQIKNLAKNLLTFRGKGGTAKTTKEIKYSSKSKNFKNKISKSNKSVGMKTNLSGSIGVKNKTCTLNNNTNDQMKKIKVNLKKNINHHYNHSIQDQTKKSDVNNEELHSKHDNLSTNRNNKIKLNELNLCYTKKCSIDFSKSFATLEEKDYTNSNKYAIYQKKHGINNRKKRINFSGNKLDYKSSIFKKNLFNDSNDNEMNSFDFDKKEIITYNILRNNHYNIITNEISMSLSKENKLPKIC